MAQRQVAQNGAKRAYPDVVVVGDRNVVSAIELSTQSDVASGLTVDCVAEPLEGSCQFAPREVPGQLHKAMTSSWTW